MSGHSLRTQNSWDETDEEIELRLQRAKSKSNDWAPTIAGIAIGLVALVTLFLYG